LTIAGVTGNIRNRARWVTENRMAEALRMSRIRPVPAAGEECGHVFKIAKLDYLVKL
jgi:hypothetical protein